MRDPYDEQHWDSRDARRGDVENGDQDTGENDSGQDPTPDDTQPGAATDDPHDTDPVRDTDNHPGELPPDLPDPA